MGYRTMPVLLHRRKVTFPEQNILQFILFICFFAFFVCVLCLFFIAAQSANQLSKHLLFSIFKSLFFRMKTADALSLG